MTGASRPSMRVGKRALAAFAAGSIAVPLSFGLMGGTAFAAAQGSSTPPAPTAIDGVCPPGQVPNSNFPDTQNDFFKDAINCLVAYGVTQGYPDGNYKPSLAVNREQMALFFFRVGKAAGMSWNTSDAGFKDINTASSQEAKDAINALANAKVIQGFTDGTYRPAVVVHRDAMAKFIANTVKVLGGPDLTTSTNDYYTDDAGNIFENFINGITDGKISNGVGSHLYGPGLPVQRDAMAGFISRSMEVLYEAGKLPSQFNANVSSVTVSPTTQQAGNPVTVTVNSASGAPAISSVKVSGACVPDTTATSDQNATDAGFQVNVPTTTTAAAGNCTLTVVTTFADGTTATNKVPLTITAAPQTATNLPQLISASIVKTTSTTSANATNPAGTTVQYVFSQPVSAATINPNGFKVYNFQDDYFVASAAAVDSSNKNAVDALFPNTTPTGGPSGTNCTVTGTSACDLTTSTGAGNLSLATVVDNDSGGPAVTLPVGSNPDGSAAIGSSNTLAAPTAGVTTAPDPESYTITQTSGASTTFPNSTPINVTFDQKAFATSTTGAGFSVIYTSGATNEAACTGPLSTDTTTPSGGTVPGGNGTTTLTIVCPNNPAAASTPLTASAISRVVVGAGAVSSAASGGVPNPLEVVDSPRNAETHPYATNVQIVPGSTSSGTPDRIVATFSQPVTPTTVNNFGLYDANAQTYFCGTAITCSAQQNPSNFNQIIVTLQGTPPSVIPTNITGGIAEAGAVTGQNTGLTNNDDELGVTNPNASSSTFGPGAVNAPQLTGVKINTTTDAITGATTHTATYTFSRPVTLNDATGLHLYDADGTRLDCTSATQGTQTSASTNNTVTCTAFTQPSTPTSAATAAQLTGAKLGTADYDAVEGSTSATPTPSPNANANPEGAANI